MSDDTTTATQDKPQTPSGPRVTSMCKCRDGDIQVTWPDGTVRKYIREPEGHQHGVKVIDDPSGARTGSR